MRESLSSYGVFVRPGVSDNQIRTLRDQNFEAYPELDHYLQSRPAGTYSVKASPIDEWLRDLDTICTTRVVIDYESDDSSSVADRLHDFRLALELFAAAGVALPPEINLSLPKYGRRVMVDENLEILTEGRGDINDAQADPPNHIFIYPYTPHPLDHAVASRFDRPRVGVIVHELCHVAHAYHASEYFDLSDTSLLGPAQAVLHEKVSEYATVSPRESVAETMAAVINGEDFDSEVMRIYDAFGGPPIDRLNQAFLDIPAPPAPYARGESSRSTAQAITDPADPRIGMFPRGGHTSEARSVSERVMAAALTLVNKLSWRGSSVPDANTGWNPALVTAWGVPNHFTQWLAGEAEPDDESTMTCIDVVFYAAYLAGVVDKRWLQRVYAAATAAAQDTPDGLTLTKDGYGHRIEAGGLRWAQALTKPLNFDRRRRYVIDPTTNVGGPDIPAGSVVFFNGPIGHVALSLGTRNQGRQELVSLWAFPMRFPLGRIRATTQGWMQRTSVEELVATAGLTNARIEYATPVWPTDPAATGGVASGSSARSITDPAGTGVGDRPDRGAMLGQARPAAVTSPAERAAWVKERTAPRPTTHTGIKFAELQTKVTAAAAEAHRWLDSQPQPAPARPLEEVCLAQLRALAGQLFPLGIASSQTVDDTALPSDAHTRRLLERPADWTAVPDWETL